jgi:hypothetical protein
MADAKKVKARPRKIPWKDQEIWWRPWVLFTLLYIIAFIIPDLETKFFAIFIVLYIWAGLSWLTVIAYAAILVPGYFDPSYGWVTLHSFMLLLGTFIMTQVLGKFRMVGKELSHGVMDDMEKSNPNPPTLDVAKDAAENLGEQAGEVIYHDGGYSTGGGAGVWKRISKGTQEVIDKFMKLFK